ncbi:MAG: hypothetical protein KAS46_06860 [Candidatus Aureabacteria bacterium]|nr:hypothetical protein [Candidatus Auribacterota bacterium]
MQDYSYTRRFNIKFISICLILGILVIGTSIYKIVKVKKNSHFNPSAPGSLYYAEAAFHYRYAELAAEEGENVFPLLKNDKSIQHPETINVFKYYTIMMEFFYGFLYRLFSFGLPFNLFLIYLSCFFSSLSLVMVFLITKTLFKNSLVALAASLYYITTPVSYLRIASGSFLREDFTLFFLLFSVLLILKQLDSKPNPLKGVFLGLVIVFNVSSWHLNHFIYMCMLPFFFLIYATRPTLLKKFFPALLILLLAGFTIPVLRERVFVTSILMCGLYSLLISYPLKKITKTPLNRLLLASLVFFILLMTRNMTGLYNPAYSHVFGMFFEKLKFLLEKPDDPLLLSFNARQLWESAFNSPTLSELWWLGKLVFPLGIIGSFFILWYERHKPGSGTFIASVSIILFLLSIMAKRVLVVAAPFVSVALWGCIIYGDKKNYFKIGLSSLVILNVLGLNLRPIEAGRFTPTSYNELYNWINTNTRPNDAFVAHIHLSPMVLINTGRPEVLHPKFENLAIRKKYEELITSMYSEDEEALFEFCEKNGAKYLIYDWGFFITDGNDSMRYLGAAVPDISEKAMASRLHFSSPELKYFTPVFRNSAFIVYEVSEKLDSAIKKIPYSPIYDPILYTKEKGFYKNTRKNYDEVIIAYAQKVNRASVLLKRGEAFMAADILEPVVKKVPKGSEAVFVLSQALFQLGRYEKTENLLKEYLKLMSFEDLVVEPLGAKVLELLADVYYYRGQYTESRDTLNNCLKIPTRSADVYKKLGILSNLEENEEKAEEYFNRYNEECRQPDSP